MSSASGPLQPESDFIDVIELNQPDRGMPPKQYDVSANVDPAKKASAA